MADSGSVTNMKRIGLRKIVCTPVNIERVRTALQQSPTQSTKTHALTLNFSNRSLCQILNLDLSFHPYKMQVVHQLNANGKLNRFHFCRQMQELTQQDPLALDVLLMSDEANIHVSRFVY